MDKEYKITFTNSYENWEKWANEGHGFWKVEWERIKNEYPEKLEMIAKYNNKTIKLSEIPEFIKEVGECVIDEDEIEVYNDYRE